MAKNPPENMPRITPYVLYEDLGPAIDWLVEAFGFRERFRLPGPDGEVGHAELELEPPVCEGGRWRGRRRLLFCPPR